MLRLRPTATAPDRRKVCHWVFQQMERQGRKAHKVLNLFKSY